MIQEEFDLAFKIGARHRHQEDCERIVKVAASNGIYMTSYQAGIVWDENSDRLCAGWSILPTDDELIWHEIERFVYRHLDHE